MVMVVQEEEEAEEEEEEERREEEEELQQLQHLANSSHTSPTPLTRCSRRATWGLGVLPLPLRAGLFLGVVGLSPVPIVVLLCLSLSLYVPFSMSYTLCLTPYACHMRRRIHAYEEGDTCLTLCASLGETEGGRCLSLYRG